MANEFKIKNGFFSEGSSNITGSLSVTAGITGSLLGTASFALAVAGGGGGGGVTQIIAGTNVSISPGGGTGAVTINSSGAGGSFPFTGSAQITGSLGITGSLNNGFENIARGIDSHAEGYYTIASGSYSHAEGRSTTAYGEASHAEGDTTVAPGEASHAEGESTTAYGRSAHAEGFVTVAVSPHSHTEGYSTVTGYRTDLLEALTETVSPPIGGASSKVVFTNFPGNYTSFFQSSSNVVSLYDDFTLSFTDTIYSSSYSGTYTTVFFANQPTGSHVGYLVANKAFTAFSGEYSHAEGQFTNAYGVGSHAEGYGTVASGEASHAEGYGTIASGYASHAEGYFTIASGSYQHVQGQYNQSSSAQSAFIIGNGTSDATRSNLIFASGSQVQITGSLNVSAGITGSLLGTASYATQAVSASYATQSLSSSFAATASFVNPLNQSVIVSGSLRGQVSTLSITSNTASVDISTNNFFTLNLVNGANTHINPTNLNPGQTVNIRVNQGSLGTGTVSFPSFVDQASGSLYTGSAVANAIDIVTLITFDSSLVFMSSIRNMI